MGALFCMPMSMDTCSHRHKPRIKHDALVTTCCLHSLPLVSSAKKDWKNKWPICWHCHQGITEALLISCSWFKALWKKTASDNINPKYKNINLQKPYLLEGKRQQSNQLINGITTSLNVISLWCTISYCLTANPSRIKTLGHKKKKN